MHAPLFEELWANKTLVPYSRKSVTQFGPHALRGLKNKKSGGYYKIRMLK
jgi:hypothetical protein